MDTIGEIISTFSEDDVKLFRVFINRQKKLAKRKDLELFDILLKQSKRKSRDIVNSIYKDRNTEAYHALRKSLLRHIMDFLVLKQFDEDKSSLPSVMGVIGLARYLFDNKKYALAWQYLRKAEALAINNDYFDQLNIIYMLQIEQAQTDGATTLVEILTKYVENKKLVDQNEKASLALGLVKQKLNETKLSGNVIDFEALVNQIIRDYEITNDFFGKPKLFFQLMSIFRSAVVAGKDYFSFEPFLIKNYKKFVKTTNFQSKDITYQAGLLYMISHTLYRNKKFDESSAFLIQLENCIGQGSRIARMQYLSKLILLSAANKFFLGKHDEAISILESTLLIDKNLLTQEDILNMQLNLCFYLLFIEQYSKANRTQLSIFHSKKWCEKLMGVEWVLKKDLVEVIIQFELETSEIAQNRIKSIDKAYKQFVQQPRYERVGVFTGLIAEIIYTPKKATTKEFFQKVEESFRWLPVEQEDLQAVMFYAWLKSKMLNQPAYNVLLELMAQVN